MLGSPSRAPHDHRGAPLPRIKSVRLSTPEDDEGLRACLRATPMGGRVRLVLEREPCFFDSLRVHREAQVVTALGPSGDEDEEEILGFAVRAADSLWLEGRPRRVGYLGGLRTRPAGQPSRWGGPGRGARNRAALC